MNFTQEHLIGRVDFRAFYSARGVRFDGKRAHCPFHDDRRPSFDVRQDDGRFICRSCDASGDPVTFESRRLNCSKAEAIASLRREYVSDNGHTVSSPKPEAPKTPPPDAGKLWDSLAKEDAESVSYLGGRNLWPLSDDTVRFDVSGPRWVAVPLRDTGGAIVNVQRRKIGEKDFRSIAGAPVKGTAFGQIDGPGDVGIFEGLSDFLAATLLRDSLGVIPLGSPGKGNAVGLVEARAEQLNGRRVYVLLDPDAAKEAQETASVLLRMGAEPRIISYPAGFKDLAELVEEIGAKRTAEVIAEIFGEAPVYNEPSLTIQAPPPPPKPTVSPFPDEAWAPEPLRVWREVLAPSTEAPLEFLWAAAMVVVGLSIGRNLSIRNPLTLYPNFYVLLAGRTGDSKKSTVLRIVREMLSALDVLVEILSGVVSSEGIYERLSFENHPAGVSALIFVDELAALTNAARRKGTADIFPKLNSLYYCPGEETLDRRNNPTRIVKPFPSVIAAAPAGQLPQLLSSSDISSGTLNRYLIVTGDEQPPKPRPPALGAEEFSRIAAALKPAVERLRTTPREMTFSDPEAAKLWDEFYVRWKRGRGAEPDELTSRTHEHVLKLAIVYSALMGESKLSPEAVAIAIRLGGWLEGSARRLMGAVGLSNLGQTEEWILSALRKRGGREQTRELQRCIPKALRSDFTKAVENLRRADRVDETTEDEPSGNRTKWLKLQPTADSQTIVNNGGSVSAVGRSIDPFSVPVSVLGSSGVLK